MMICSQIGQYLDMPTIARWSNLAALVRIGTATGLTVVVLAGCTGTQDGHSTVSRPSTVRVDVAPVNSEGRPRSGEQIRDGGWTQCEPGSDAVEQAYRCFAGHGVYDPCWLDNAVLTQASVLCQLKPWDMHVIQFEVQAGGLSPFSGRTTPVNLSYPWGVRLVDGELCMAVQGTHGVDHGKVVDYACGSKYNHVLLRPLNRSSQVWNYQSAYYSPSGVYRPGPQEKVATAWYANPDLGAADDARANDCTVTALAYSAQAYETSHHNPDGLLPDIIAHACEAGYAEITFAQNAVGSDYTSRIALGAALLG
jgi:hypothetical protein